MRKPLAVLFIIGLLAADIFLFRNILKPHAAITLPGYLVGFLSIVVFVALLQAFLRGRIHVDNDE